MFRMPLEAFTQDESFPFFIQYGEHEESMYLHGHDAYLELVIVLSGSATHIVDHGNQFSQNSLIIICGFIRHSNMIFEIAILELLLFLKCFTRFIAAFLNIFRLC